MSNEFMREERYIVFKISDVERYLTDKDRANITMMKREIDAGRDCANKPPFKGLIVEADWPEYEPTWKAIEARMTGAQNALEESAVQTAARIMNIELIRECDALRAKIAEMEQQESVAKVRVHQTGGNAGLAWSVAPLNDFDSLPLMRDGDRLYALPGAQNVASSQDEWKTLAKDLLREIERQTCAHEETHRGGFLWEICDSCGAKWADDEGGKPEFKWPKVVERAHAMLAAAQEAKS